MRKFLVGLGWVLGILAVLAIIGRIALFRVWTIPEDRALGASLAPSLAAGDVVLVLFRGERGFGDLVRCPDPEDPQRWVVGRIVGTQGDRVQIAGGYVTVNGKRFGSTEACVEGTLEVPHPTDGRPVQHTCSRVELGGGWHFMASAPNTTPEAPREHTVGAGRVFLLSDNRSFHDDSRDFGAVPAETCKEQVVFRIWGKGGFFDAKHRFEVIH
ncbi:MAG: signal peptidase I [Polyangiaceae bacterium]|nr:signal peptidase I [Polyangiaceae bacterium]